jgi:hypothetical protein
MEFDHSAQQPTASERQNKVRIFLEINPALKQFVLRLQIFIVTLFMYVNFMFIALQYTYL